MDAAAPQVEGVRTAREVVVFRAGVQRYAVEVSRVRVIVSCGRVARVPGAPPHVLGVTRHQGEIVPVLDLVGSLEGAPSARAEAGGLLLVVDVAGVETGVAFRFDELDDLVTIDDEALDPPLPNLDERARERVVGVFVREDELVPLLDPERLVGVVGR